MEDPKVPSRRIIIELMQQEIGSPGGAYSRAKTLDWRYRPPIPSVLEAKLDLGARTLFKRRVAAPASKSHLNKGIRVLRDPLHTQALAATRRPSLDGNARTAIKIRVFSKLMY